MLAAAIELCSDVVTGHEPRWLVLCGHSGTGKTHLAKKCADFLRRFGEWSYNKHGRRTVDPRLERYESTYGYAQAGAMLVKWASVIDAARDNDFGPYKHVAADWYKVIDDVGSEGFGQDKKPTAFVVNQLGKLADARLGKWTVWTTNFSLGDFAEHFDTRISSRMLRDGNVVVDVRMRDFNMRKRA